MYGISLPSSPFSKGYVAFQWLDHDSVVGLFVLIITGLMCQWCYVIFFLGRSSQRWSLWETSFHQLKDTCYIISHILSLYTRLLKTKSHKCLNTSLMVISKQEQRLTVWAADKPFKLINTVNLEFYCVLYEFIIWSIQRGHTVCQPLSWM